MSLSFDEFRATIRRYGKIPPREMASQEDQAKDGFRSKAISDEDLRVIFNRVDDSGDGEIQIEEFKDWLDEQPSDEYQKFERSIAVSGKTRNIRVKAIDKNELKRIWKLWDANRSGVLSLAELDKSIVNDPPSGWSGFEKADPSLIIAFSYADDDWSGEVAFAEFEGLMKNVVFCELKGAALLATQHAC